MYITGHWCMAGIGFGECRTYSFYIGIKKKEFLYIAAYRLKLLKKEP